MMMTLAKYTLVFEKKKKFELLFESKEKWEAILEGRSSSPLLFQLYIVTVFFAQAEKVVLYAFA